jgi:mono/diheme cytochrome c family protein
MMIPGRVPTVVLLAGALTGLTIVSGCSAPEAEQVFSLAAETEELPEVQRESVRDNLQTLFGTPDNPRLMVLGDEGSDGGTEDPDDQPAEAGPALVDAEGFDREHLRHGAAVYKNRCSGCHGITGDGQGPAAEFLMPKPRDYRQGIFKFTSTSYGLKPARQDLIRTIRRGAKGTSMPAFPWMSDRDLEAVVDYVILLSLRGEVEKYASIVAFDYGEDEPLDILDFLDGLDQARAEWEDASAQIVQPVSAEPPRDESSVTMGRQIFLSEGCAKCHGQNAEGQTEWLSQEFLQRQQSLPDAQREQINYDAWGHPAPAADITARLLHGGRRPLDIYRRIHTGINGTPMPAFGQLWASEPDKIWHLVHYVLHIIEGGDPTAGVTGEPSGQTEGEAVSATPDADFLTPGLG